MAIEIKTYLEKEEYYPSIDSYISEVIDQNPNIDRIKNIRSSYKDSITTNFVDQASQMVIKNILYVHVNSGRSTIKVGFVNSDIDEDAKKKLKESKSYDCIIELPYTVDFSGIKSKETPIITKVYDKASNILLKGVENPKRATTSNQYIRTLKYTDSTIGIGEDNQKEIFFGVLQMGIE